MNGFFLMSFFWTGWRCSPAWLKRWLVPIWNAGHQFAWWTRDRSWAVLGGQIERCGVCGRLGLMIYRRRIISPELVRRWGLSEPLAQAFARKESLACSRCGANLRGRRLALVLLDRYPVGEPTPRSVADWAGRPDANRLRVAEINRVDGLHDALIVLRHFAASDHSEGAEPGSVVDGVRHEDLTRLTYPDASFDLILTSETLEHVPDLAAALAEIHRVLIPGGRHLFTVPLLPGIATTFPRARLIDDGSIITLAPPIHHPGGDTGWPVFTEFGADLPALLQRAGFEVTVHFGPLTDRDVAQVFDARKSLKD